jgi:hypothetical protein
MRGCTEAIIENAFRAVVIYLNQALRSSRGPFQIRDDFFGYLMLGNYAPVLQRGG